MGVMLILIPIALLMGVGGLAAFFWAVKNNQYDDPQGDAARILMKDYDDSPL